MKDGATYDNIVQVHTVYTVKEQPSPAPASLLGNILQWYTCFPKYPVANPAEVRPRI